MKRLLIGALLLLVGVVLVAATVYQELTEEPEFPEDYHMQIPTEKYEWRSRNIAVTLLGVAIIVFSLAFVIVELWKR